MIKQTSKKKLGSLDCGIGNSVGGTLLCLQVSTEEWHSARGLILKAGAKQSFEQIGALEISAYFQLEHYLTLPTRILASFLDILFFSSSPKLLHSCAMY